MLVRKVAFKSLYKKTLILCLYGAVFLFSGIGVKRAFTSCLEEDLKEKYNAIRLSFSDGRCIERTETGTYLTGSFSCLERVTLMGVLTDTNDVFISAIQKAITGKKEKMRLIITVSDPLKKPSHLLLSKEEDLWTHPP